MYRRKKWSLAAAAAAAATLTISACGGSAPSNSATGGSNATAGTSATASGTLNWAGTLPSSWDPTLSGCGCDIAEQSLVYAGLFQVDSKGSPEPALAQSGTFSTDGLIYTVKLKSGLRFSDGTPVNAAAVVYSLDRARAKTSLIAATLAPVEDITAANATTVTITLSQKDYQLPLTLSGRSGEIESPKASAASLATAPVGAGPFILTSFVAGSHADFTKNPGYWDAAAIKIENLNLTVAPDPSTVIAGLETGSIDVATLQPSQVAQAKASGLKVTVAPSLDDAWLDVNSNRKPFNNPDVLNALRYAINRPTVAQATQFGYDQISNQPWPSSYVGYDTNAAFNALWPYDPAKARQLLAAAGYGPGNPLKFQITVASSAYTELGEALQSQWQAVGADATIDVATNFVSQVYVEKNATVAQAGTVGRESPVEELINQFGPTGNLNLAAPFTAPGFQAAISKVESIPVGAAGYEAALQQATEIGVEGSPEIQLWTSEDLYATSSHVTSALNILLNSIRWEGVTVSS